MGSLAKLGLILFTVSVVGCGGGGEGDGGDGVNPPIDAPGATDAAMPSGYTRLVGRPWTLPGGTPDTYRCVRYTVTEDTYLTSIMAQAPLGTHHTVLSIATGSRVAGPDGEYNCQVFDLGNVMLYASGVGTSPLDFPDGVGIKIAAGTQIHLNLHLYNTSDSDLSGESAILVKAQSTPPPTLAEMVFAGTQGISIASGETKTVSGGCLVNRPFTIFALWPHMHQIATKQKIDLLRSGASMPTTLLDENYSFSEQKYYRQNPMIEVAAGDRITVACTYTNTTGRTVGFGDSSDSEMCFGGLYRYPAENSGLFSCVDR